MSVSIEEVSHNLDCAGRTLLLLPMTGCAPSGLRACWPEAPSEWAAYGYYPPQTKPPIPSPQEISGMDTVFLWLRHIPEPNIRKIVLYRCLCDPHTGRRLWPYRRLGRHFGWSHEAVRVWHQQGLQQIVRGLNGQSPR